MSEELGKDKKIDEEEEEEVEYVLLELGDCLYSDVSPDTPFVLSVSCFFAGSYNSAPLGCSVTVICSSNFGS